jgi:hypothetical protein
MHARALPHTHSQTYTFGKFNNPLLRRHRRLIRLRQCVGCLLEGAIRKLIPPVSFINVISCIRPVIEFIDNERDLPASLYSRHQSDILDR